MSASEDLGGVRRKLQGGEVGRGLSELERQKDIANKSGDVETLRAVVEVAEWAAETLAGRDKKKAQQVGYAAKQNLNFLVRKTGATSGPAPAVDPQVATQDDSSGVGHRMVVKGHNGTIILDDDFVTISRKGFLARASVGKGDKRLLIGHITAVQFKPAGPVTNGFIQFTVGGGNEARSHFGRQTRDAAHDENSVIFWWAQRAEFQALRDATEEAIAARHRPVPTAPASASASLPEQISQLAALRDAGILTDAEFEAKKTDLLSRI
jgi:hypothetical protein